MGWFKRERWKASIVLAGMPLLLALLVWIPVSAAGAYEGTSGLATPVTATVQATPTVDQTMTALQKEQLTQQVRQLQNQYSWPNWFFNNITAVIAGGVALFGIIQWAGNRRDERRKETVAQDKELRDRAEERFKAAVTALGDKNEGPQVGGAILLRSFLKEEDKEIYERYYTQIFDLAVAYLRISRPPLPPEDPNIILPLTALRQALIIVFKEAFPLARDERKQNLSLFDPRLLNASHIQLDSAYLAHTDLNDAWMREALLRRANLGEADLSRADLVAANFTEAHLGHACLNGAKLRYAILDRANLSGADLSETNIEEAQSLKDADLRGVKGLTKEQLEACKAKGAFIDEDITTSPPQSPASPPVPSQSTNAQAPSVPSAQVNTPPPTTDGSSTASSKSGPEL